MSKYIKLEDAIRNINLEVTGRKEYTGDMKANLFFALDDLPTIEVSEDNEPTWEQVKEYCFKRNFAIVGRELPKEYIRESGYTEVSEDCISSEIWKPIPNFEGLYEASSIGRIRSVERKVNSGRGERTASSKILKPILDEWGYEKVSLSKDGKCVSRKVNRLVAQAFIPNPNDYPQVNHKDGIKTHNYVENLEWCTASQNMKHCFENGMSNWQTKVKIIETGQVFDSLSECARAIGGHINNIQMCLKGRRKTHKGYHFEIVGDRASDKYGRNNYKENKQEYDSKVKIEHNGEVHSLREWSEILGIKLSTLTNRYYRGDRGEHLFRTVIERENAPSVVPTVRKNRTVEKSCDTCKHNKLEWLSEECDGCTKANSNYERIEE